MKIIEMAALALIGVGLASCSYGIGVGLELLGKIPASAAGSYEPKPLKVLDEADRPFAQQATRQALEQNQEVAWSNPDSSNSGSITPTRTFQNPAGQLCHTYRLTFSPGGEIIGHGCRQDDGTWRIYGPAASFD